MTTTPTRPAFRKPWEHGARAYHEADTFEAALAGFKRARTSKMFLMPNSGEAGQKRCASCALRLGGPIPGQEKIDQFSTWVYDPKRKAVVGGQHYVCSWGSLINEAFDQADRGILR